MEYSAPNLIPTPFASDGDKNTIAQSYTDPSSGNATYQVGFPPITQLPRASGGLPPSRADMNGILYDLSSNIRYLNTGGIARFNQAFCDAIGGYPKGAVIQSDDGTKSWTSLVDNNTTNPNSNTTNWQNYSFDINKVITNCITEIQQDIKLELVDGTLTVLGKVRTPNGFETDGVTPKYNVTEVNLSRSAAPSTPNFVFIRGGGILLIPVSLCFSGDSEPTYTGGSTEVWFNTASNQILSTSDGVTWGGNLISLPLGIITTSVDQVFNGFGYVGSTVFVLPNVKGLIANGRNADGTLDNIEFVFDKVFTRNVEGGTYNTNFILQGLDNNYYLNTPGSKIRKWFYQEQQPTQAGGWFNTANGFWYYSSDGATWNRNNVLILGDFVSIENGKITSLSTKLPFQAIDYSDKADVAGWSMPSDKYVDLTLGASGSTYTAPANGWFAISKIANSTNQYVDLTNETTKIAIQVRGPESTTACRCYVPARKGDIVDVMYTAGGELQYFRFIYAEGAK